MRRDDRASPPRLVCLTTSAARGGAEMSLMTLLTAFRQLEPKCAVTVVAPSTGPLIDWCRDTGISTVVLPYPAALSTLGETGTMRNARRMVSVRFAMACVRAALGIPGYLLALRRVLIEQRPAVLHTNGVKAHIVGALAKPAGTRLVWHLHDYVRSRPITAGLLRRLGGRADAIVANSDSVGRDAEAAFGGRARVRRVYNAVDPAVFSPVGPALDLAAAAGLAEDRGLVRIGLVATFAMWKGHDVFIDAIARLRDDGCPVRGYIIGDAVYETAGSQWSREELAICVAQAGLSSIVGLTGHVSDAAAAMRALDVVVHASTQPEPFGMVIAEAMASGRALVAVNAGGAAELFEDGVDALGYAGGDAAELADRLRELIRDPDRRAALAASARRHACERFKPQRMAREFREVYLG